AGAGWLGAGIAGSLSGQLGTTAGPGVPGIDAHNRDLLAADLESTDAATLAMALGVRAALQRAAADGGVGQLLVYESPHDGGQGRAAISVGDITTADNVATLAPGVGNAPVNMVEGISDAAALRRQAELEAPGDATAVVSWYGYDIPLSAVRGVPVDLFSALGNTVAALDDRNARAGGSQLVTDLAQFRHWAPDGARFVAVGFSMGSTTVSAAAARGARLDDLVLLGSPGASTDVETADDYPDVPADHTFVVSYDQDPVTRGQTDLLAGVLGAAIHGPTQSTPFGPDPASKGFGAQVVDADSNNPDINVELHTGGLGGPLADLLGSELADQFADLAAHHQESNYLSGESLDAVAAVVVGQYSDVPVKPGR
ncbi:MAG TPA: alpha/beta hydrolase, partial [Nakamurella sp.]